MGPPSLTFEPARCTACMACELTCSFVKEQVFTLAFSRIKVVQVYELGVNVPIACLHCEEAPCIPSCPSEAIVQAGEWGPLRIIAELCSGCGECVEACPYGAVHVPCEREVAALCDLCGGRPACVSSCLYGALRFEGRPDATFASLELATAGLELPAKQWQVATALAERLVAAWEMRS